MSTTGIDLPATIRKLSRLYDDDQLDTLIADHVADCRGLTNDRGQLYTASELFRVGRITRVLAMMCEMPIERLDPMVRSVLLRHPRRESMLSLIDEYTRDAVAFNKLGHERERTKSR